MPSDAMEEKYLRLRDDHTALKKKSNEQQDTIKRMYTKLAMIEENLKRKDRGDAIPSPAKVGGGARNAEAERLVVDLRIASYSHTRGEGRAAETAALPTFCQPRWPPRFFVSTHFFSRR